MAEDLDAAIAEFEQKGPSDPTPEPIESPATTEPSDSPPAEAPAESRRYSLDDALPDDPRIPESMRGKPLSVLVEDRLERDKAAKQAGFQKNSEHERAEGFKTALELLARRMDPEARKPEKPQARPSDAMRQRGVDPATVYTDAAAFVDASTETARETILPEVYQEIQKLHLRINQNEQEKEEDRIRTAYAQARPQNVSAERWNAMAPDLATRVHIAAQNAGVDTRSIAKDPRAYTAAYEEAVSAWGGPKASAAVAPAPSAPAPPVGNGNSAPPQRKSTARISPHVRGAFNEVVEVLNSIGVKSTTDEILDGMKGEPKYREMFE